MGTVPCGKSVLQILDGRDTFSSIMLRLEKRWEVSKAAGRRYRKNVVEYVEKCLTLLAKVSSLSNLIELTSLPYRQGDTSELSPFGLPYTCAITDTVTEGKGDSDGSRCGWI